MKKIMMAAAIACVAAITQAATYNWNTSFSAVYNGYESTAGIGTVWTGASVVPSLNWYLVCTDTISQNDLLTKFRSGESLAKYALTSGTTGTDGKQTQTDTFTADQGLVRSDGKMYSYLAVISPDEDAIFLSADKAVTANTSATGVASITPATGNNTKKLQDADGTASFDSAGWYTAVPEPTSGLLLLLGMAGLALRRRRA